MLLDQKQSTDLIEKKKRNHEKKWRKIYQSNKIATCFALFYNILMPVRMLTIWFSNANQTESSMKWITLWWWCKEKNKLKHITKLNSSMPYLPFCSFEPAFPSKSK